MIHLKNTGGGTTRSGKETINCSDKTQGTSDSATGAQIRGEPGVRTISASNQAETGDKTTKAAAVPTSETVPDETVQSLGPLVLSASTRDRVGAGAARSVQITVPEQVVSGGKTETELASGAERDRAESLSAALPPLDVGFRVFQLQMQPARAAIVPAQVLAQAQVPVLPQASAPASAAAQFQNLCVADGGFSQERLFTLITALGLPLDLPCRRLFLSEDGVRTAAGSGIRTEEGADTEQVLGEVELWCYGEQLMACGELELSGAQFTQMLGLSPRRLVLRSALTVHQVVDDNALVTLSGASLQQWLYRHLPECSWYLLP